MLAKSSKVFPGVGAILSRGPCFCKKLFALGQDSRLPLKIPGGLPGGGERCWSLELTDTLCIDESQMFS